MRVLIVDDEVIARRGLRRYLAAAPDIEIVGECKNGFDAVAAIGEQRPDLVFLDVEMPGLDGFAMLARLDPAAMPAIIFVTAWDKYAIHAFEVNALDYLLKPFDSERLLASVDRARRNAEQRGKASLAERLNSLLRDLPRSSAPERIAVREQGRIFFLALHEIDWIEAAGNYACLHAGPSTHLIRETITSLESRLPDFVRIRKSTLVNAPKIRELRPAFHGEYEVVLRDGTVLASSRRYGESIRKLIDR